MEEDSSNVSDNLSDTADEQGDREAPSPPSEAEIEMNQADGSEEGGKGNICGERGLVGEDAPFDGAVVQVARLTGTERDDGVGRGLRRLNHDEDGDE